MNPVDFDLRTQPLENGLVLEASAGTGKTWTIASLVAREIARDDSLRIGNVMITTFTRAAAAELRERVRKRLIESAEHVDPDVPPGATKTSASSDPLFTLLCDADESEKRLRAARLRRAALEFDTAIIGTIHSICSRILTLAGEPMPGMDEQHDDHRVVRELVNDALVAEAGEGRSWDFEPWRQVVSAFLNRPDALPWWSPELAPTDKEKVGHAEARLRDVLEKWKQRSQRKPSYTELVRRAAELLDGPGADTVRSRIVQQVTLVFVDEAQDTDGLQWRLFHGLFPPTNTDGARLVAVGDPKQAIYSFRGADVHAYLDVRREDRMRTLGTNFRSDRPLVDALNRLFAGARFGEEIEYRPVAASEGKQESRLTGAAPVTVVDVDDNDQAMRIAGLAARRVRQLLATVRLKDDKDVPQTLLPRQICVLARSNAVAARVQKLLTASGIPAVNSGTESVFAGEMAGALATLLTAMHRLADMGHVRRVAVGLFFGYSLTDPELFPADMREGADPDAERPDVLLGIQEKLAYWKQQLVKGGAAALVAALQSDTDVMRRILAGPAGERRLTDLAHVAEIWQEETLGKGIAPDALRAIHDRLVALPDQSDMVLRRVESDQDAVQLMTIHRSKGLQFPVVVVADGWKMDDKRGAAKVAAFRRTVQPADVALRPELRDALGKKRTFVDIGLLAECPHDDAVAWAKKEAEDERRRLLYVALTRPEHHLTLLWASGGKPGLLQSTLNADALVPDNPADETGIEIVSLTDLPSMSPWAPAGSESEPELATADAPERIDVTALRTSFTALVAARHARAPVSAQADPGESGTDEGALATSGRRGVAGDDQPLGVPEMPLARIRGGTYFGRLVHRIFETVDPSVDDLEAHVAAICGPILDVPGWREQAPAVVDGLTRCLRTPLGSVLGNRTLADFPTSKRLAELSFDIGAGSRADGVRVRDIGKRLLEILPPGDPLLPYADRLAHPSFSQPVAGLVTGSVDAVLQQGTDTAPRLVLVDYKTNRLDSDGHPAVIDGYRRAGVWAAMEEHDYPLQFLLYGVVLHRFLRWRLPDTDIDGAITGVAYCFVRGMVGPQTPVDSDGNPAGVFAWPVPRGLFAALSDLLAGKGGL